MKTIIIQIQVPDGIDVQVSHGGGRASNGQQQAFTPQPDPDYPEGFCAVCGNDEWRLIKAGVSRTKRNPDGTPKRFNAFYVCGTEGCDGKPGQDQRDERAMESMEESLPF